MAVLKVQADLPDTNPGQNVTFILFGDSTLEPAPDHTNAFYLSTELGEIACKQIPENSLLIRSPSHLTVSFQINGVAISASSVLVVRSTANGGLLFGLQLGLGATAARSIAVRLLVLPLAARIVIGTLVGGLLTAWAFANLHVLFYRLPPDSPLLLPGALIFVSRLAISTAVRQRAMRAVLVAGGVLIALMATWLISLETEADPLLYFEANSQIGIWPQGLLVAALIGLVSQSGGWWRRLAHRILVWTT